MNVIDLEAARAAGRVVEAMAEIIAARREALGACDIDDLSAAGFTAAEIIEYQLDAVRLLDQRTRETPARDVA